MAIDTIKKVAIVCPATAVQRLIKTLHELGIVEIIDALEQFDEAKGKLQRQEVSTEESDTHLQQINLVLSLLDTFAPEKKGFFEGLTPLPLVIEPRELQETLQSFDLEAHYATAHELDEIQRNAERKISEVQNRLKELAAFEDIPFSVQDLKRLHRIRLLLGFIPAKHLEALGQDEAVRKWLAWDVVVPGQLLRKDAGANLDRPVKELAATLGDPLRIIAAFQPENEEAARKALAAHEFEEIPLPEIPGKVRDHVRELKGDLAECEEQIAQIKTKVLDLSKHRRALGVLKAFWESNRNRRLALTSSAAGKWVQLLTGYVREKDLPRLEETLRRAFPEASYSVSNPAPEESVPVSLSLPHFVRPVQMLVDLFGLPQYRTFDPSPFILVSFFLFFGICFSDVAYGIMLTALGAYLSAKTKAYRGLNNFSRIFLYAGISTVIFGALLGSWFGDLYRAEYLGEGNVLLRLQRTFAVLDPMDKPIVALVIALCIGMLNQFYGIALKMYGAIRQQDWAAAIFDGLFWLILLPGMVMLISLMFVQLPRPVVTVAVTMVVAGSLGLVLTQGRSSPGIAGRLLTGVVSLYGIVGSYGCTAFIGDTLSYCRLLALGLTTGIVAQSFNMMAGMLRDVPYVGIVLFIVALVIGHVFNFLISILGAFVHSMRLIFVEFFGRFYAGGARPFRPLGFDTATAILKKTA
ncbi:MAG: V-type ATP synthase subunit I [Candidatus Hydrogenedentes bacterium]|nr:V-type ATP synthase subunit I [Candidatus Hydrogenedentota bacterium]